MSKALAQTMVTGTRSKAPRIEDHPTASAVLARGKRTPEMVTVAMVRQIALDAGADDVGVAVSVTVDGKLWLDIVNKKKSPVVAVIMRRMVVRGDRSLLDRFAACFPR